MPPCIQKCQKHHWLWLPFTRNTSLCQWVVKGMVPQPALDFVPMLASLHHGVVTMESLTLEFCDLNCSLFCGSRCGNQGKADYSRLCSCELVKVLRTGPWLWKSSLFGFQTTLRMVDLRFFLPVQRIHSKFLFVDKICSGQRYLICSPICRRILL